MENPMPAAPTRVGCPGIAGSAMTSADSTVASNRLFGPSCGVPAAEALSAGAGAGSSVITSESWPFGKVGGGVAGVICEMMSGSGGGTSRGSAATTDGEPTGLRTATDVVGGVTGF